MGRTALFIFRESSSSILNLGYRAILDKNEAREPMKSTGYNRQESPDEDDSYCFRFELISAMNSENADVIGDSGRNRRIKVKYGFSREFNLR